MAEAPTDKPLTKLIDEVNYCCIRATSAYKFGLLGPWVEAVTNGNIAYDPVVEKQILDIGRSLLTKMWALQGYYNQLPIHRPAITSFDLLDRVAWGIDNLLKDWVSPTPVKDPAVTAALNEYFKEMTDFQTTINAVKAV